MMFGLGKSRSKLGAWVDKKLGSQQRLMDLCGIDKNTAGSVCNQSGRRPNQSTRGRIITGLRRAGFDVYEEDFWP